MDELTFRVAYVGFSAIFLGLLLFFLGRRFIGKMYLIPVAAGFFFGVGTSLILGGGIISLLLAGVLTGYMTKSTSSWHSLFRVGGFNGALIMIALFLPGAYFLFTTSLPEILTAYSPTLERTIAADQLLLELIWWNSIYSFIYVGIVGLGSVLGGQLRKLLKPAQQKAQ